MNFDDGDVTFAEFYAALLDFCPSAEIDQDSEGQIIIYTNLKEQTTVGDLGQTQTWVVPHDFEDPDGGVEIDDDEFAHFVNGLVTQAPTPTITAHEPGTILGPTAHHVILDVIQAVPTVPGMGVWDETAHGVVSTGQGQSIECLIEWHQEPDSDEAEWYHSGLPLATVYYADCEWKFEVYKIGIAVLHNPDLDIHLDSPSDFRNYFPDGKIYAPAIEGWQWTAQARFVLEGINVDGSSAGAGVNLYSLREALEEAETRLKASWEHGNDIPMFGPGPHTVPTPQPVPEPF